MMIHKRHYSLYNHFLSFDKGKTILVSYITCRQIRVNFIIFINMAGKDNNNNNNKDSNNNNKDSKDSKKMSPNDDAKKAPPDTNNNKSYLPSPRDNRDDDRTIANVTIGDDEKAKVKGTPLPSPFLRPGETPATQSVARMPETPAAGSYVQGFVSF